MWRSIYCYLSGQHDYTVTCEPGAIFLQCRACGQRSSGWALREALVTERRDPALARVEAGHHAPARRAAA
jgi:hypothetical protein